ncbi:hypothetical protein P43SY_008803 [Pythium insidiosum]|uniref:40S ribosomal protein S29 n=1 Tax=Pythium insidiosum TaxID=114742 RepID=A0AAD5M762_PYTIN|nr:hypothetical protein P43SY_008803 [Pythium insidiosum]
MTNLQNTHPRNYGKDSRHCRVCHTTRGLIRKYGLNMCRRCFRERATQIGFVKRGASSTMRSATSRRRVLSPRVLSLLLLLLPLALPLVLSAAPFSTSGLVDFPIKDLETIDRIKRKPGAPPDPMAPHLSSPTTRKWTHVDAIALGALRSDELLSLDRHDVLHVGGQGRRRATGLSISHAMTGRELGADAPQPLKSDEDGQKVSLFPRELVMEDAEACVPTMHWVGVENDGAHSLRIEAVHFDHDGLSLATDVTGAVVEAGTDLNMVLVVLSSEPEDIDAYMVVTTTAGVFSMAIRGRITPNAHGVTGIRVALPVDTRLEQPLRVFNPDAATLQVSEVFLSEGVGSVLLPPADGPAERQSATSPSDVMVPWQVAPRTSQTVARYFFPGTHSAGRYRSIVQIAIPNKQNLLVPVVVDVLDTEELYVESRELDLGVLMNGEERREVMLTLQNPGALPLLIRSVELLEPTPLQITARLRGSPVLPPRSRARRAVGIHVRMPHDMAYSGPIAVQLVVRTARTDPKRQRRDDVEERTHTIRLRAFTTRGSLSLPLRESIVMVQDDPIIDHFLQAKSKTPFTVAPMGEYTEHELHLTNDLDTAIEVEAIDMFPPECLDVRLIRYETGVIVLPHQPLPRLVAALSPGIKTAPGHGHASAQCYIAIQTNASQHYVPIVLHRGDVRVASSLPLRELQDRNQSPCFKLPSSPKRCRSVVLDLGRVATEATLVEAINVTNVNPIDMRVTATRVVPSKSPRRFETAVRAGVHPDPDVPVATAMIGEAWSRRARRGEQPQTEPAKGGGILVAVPPGSVLNMRVRFTMKDTFGSFVDPVMKLETDHEVIHVAVRYQVIDARVEWPSQIVKMPAGHPGRIILHELSINSVLPPHMDAVHVRRVITSNDLIKVWHVPSILPSNVTTTISVSAFPFEYAEACRSGHFYADCFLLGAPASANEPKHHEYSNYGSPVSREDLVAWRQRERVWSGTKYDELRLFSTQLTIVTDVMETAPLNILTPLARPILLSVSMLELPLTESLHHSAVDVTVENPSDFAVDVELTIADADADADTPDARDSRSLFYACDDDLTDAECLREWQDIAREAAADPDGDIVAPFFFRERVVLRMQPRETITLGPIHFFPSVVGEWKTRVFVRNQITHIEAVDLHARSGRGKLEIELQSEVAPVPLEVYGYHTITFPVPERADEGGDGVDFSVTRSKFYLGFVAMLQTKSEEASTDDEDNEFEVLSSPEPQDYEPVAVSESKLGKIDALEADRKAADDDWSDFSFESLQSEIGKLLVADDVVDQSTPSMALSRETRRAMSSQTTPSLRSAPPGFSPEDANPEASRAAFERLLHYPHLGRDDLSDRPFAPSSTLGSSQQSAFPQQYSLFGPPLGLPPMSPSSSPPPAPAEDAQCAGRIGGRRRLVSTLRVTTENPRGHDDSSPLAALGGVALDASSAP